MEIASDEKPRRVRFRVIVNFAWGVGFRPRLHPERQMAVMNDPPLAREGYGNLAE